MSDYNELAGYVSLWGTCPGCDELTNADDFIIREDGLLCPDCSNCPHGRDLSGVPDVRGPRVWPAS